MKNLREFLVVCEKNRNFAAVKSKKQRRIVNEK